MNQQPIAIRLSARMYTALLILYPAPYRKAYGNHMAQVFEDVARDCYGRQGIPGMVYWWGSTMLDLIVTAIEQRKEGTSIMSKLLALQPPKGPALGLMVMLGGLFYAVGGLWLIVAGTPGDIMGIQLTHLLRMMWLGGTVCALMGIGVTDGIEDGVVPHAAAWVCGIGLVIIQLEALNALVTRYPISAFATTALPFSTALETVPLLGWAVLTVYILYGNRWQGWTKLTALGMLLAPFVGLLLGGLLGITLLPIVVMGLALLALGFAVRTRLEDKRQNPTMPVTAAPGDTLKSPSI
jgi:hypothetical protein